LVWYWAWLYRDTSSFSRQKVHLALGLFIVTYAFFAHPVSAILIGLIAGFYVVEQKQWKSIPAYATVGMAAVWVIVKYMFTPKDSYEGNFMNEEVLSVDRLSNLWDLPMLHLYQFKFEAVYFYPTLLMLLGLTWLIWKRRWWLLAYTVVGTTLMLAAIVVAFGQGDSHLMIEARWIIPSSMVALLAIRWLHSPADQKKLPTITQWVLTLVIAVCLVQGIRGISKASRYHTKRVAQLQTLVDSARAQGLTRAWAVSQDLPNNELLVDWAVPFETMLLSALDDPLETVMITVYPNPLLPDPEADHSGQLLVPSFTEPKAPSKLNHDYFRFDHSEAQELSPSPSLPAK